MRYASIFPDIKLPDYSKERAHEAVYKNKSKLFLDNPPPYILKISNPQRFQKQKLDK